MSGPKIISNYLLFSFLILIPLYTANANATAINTTYGTNVGSVPNLNKIQDNGLAPSQIEEIEEAPPKSNPTSPAIAVIGPDKSVAIYKPTITHTKPTSKLLKPLPLQIG